jgi:hypothetical protein
LEEDKVSAKEGFSAVASMFGDNPEHMVISDDEVLSNMKKDLEKRIAKEQNPEAKKELEKELLILEILIIQREKIDREAEILLNDGEAFGKDYDDEKAKKKKKKERDKQQQVLIDKLNELGISNLNIDIKTPTNSDGREKGGMERKERIR